ncbi:MAG TPA: hypothetical protein VMU32_01085, partial [Solirubrobacteraceae bacterium]|nr:hypothetical protein [Solirubrobacteraceae bacterium]
QAVSEHGESSRRGRGAARGRSLLGRLGLAGGERGARPVRATRREPAPTGPERAPLSDASVLGEQWDDIGTHWAGGRGERATGQRAPLAREQARRDTADGAGVGGDREMPAASSEVDDGLEALAGSPEEIETASGELAGDGDPSAAAADPDEAFGHDAHASSEQGGSQGDLERALAIFNAGEHPRRIAGVTRALGPACLKVAPLADAERTVAIVAAWELCWYRYEVDLADETAGARLAAEGMELEELAPADREPNAVADERGELALLVA